jgi:hypothetical protein
MKDHYLLLVGISLLNFLGFTLFITWGTLLLNISIQPYGMIISLLLCSLLLWKALPGKSISNDAEKERTFKYIMAELFASLIICLLLAGAFHDFSYDGQNYQQEALIQLYQGWNPFWDPALSEDIPYSLWINSYPKALWYFGTAVYQFTGLIETGKMFQGILLLGTLFITHSALRFFLKSNVLCWLTSFLLVANPVAVVQFFTFYVDGVLYLILLALIALGYVRYFLGKQKEADCVILDIGIALAIIVLSNIKFTGLVYASLFCTGWIFFNLFNRQRKTLLKLCTISLITSCLLVGYHPYITNLIHHGHPFWPLMGKNSVDIITPNEHPDFLKQNRLTKIIWSTLATGRNNADFSPAPMPKPRGTPELKIPFTFSQYELKLYESADTRIGGFGPWFSGILICSVLLGSFLTLRHQTLRNHFVFLITGLLISILINPEAWWARYAPQLWMIPLIILIYACYITEIQTNPKLKYLTSLFLCIAVINSTLVVFLSVREQICNEYQLQRQLKVVNEYIAKNHRSVLIDFSTFQANRKRFQEKGISYIAVDGGKQLDIPFFQLAGSRTKVYIPDQNLINELTKDTSIP